VFDSGLGGLTAVRELMRALPLESVAYFGDTARVPYGNKSRETVTRFGLEISAFLGHQNVKCVVVACNTASSLALPELVRESAVPVIGVIEPAVRVAIEQSPNRRIGVIGTHGTIGSGAYAAAIERLAPGTHVMSRACPLFVPLVEEGWLRHPVTRAVAEEYLAELKGARLDTLILGCTHYPLLQGLIAEVMGPGVTLVDSGAAAAHATAAVLEKANALAAGPAQHRFYLSDEPRAFEKVGSSFLGRAMPPVTVVDQNDLHWFERASLGTPRSGT